MLGSLNVIVFFLAEQDDHDLARPHILQFTSVPTRFPFSFSDAEAETDRAEMFTDPEHVNSRDFRARVLVFPLSGH